MVKRVYEGEDKDRSGHIEQSEFTRGLYFVFFGLLAVFFNFLLAMGVTYGTTSLVLRSWRHCFFPLQAWEQVFRGIYCAFFIPLARGWGCKNKSNFITKKDAILRHFSLLLHFHFLPSSYLAPPPSGIILDQLS